jgi:hypothetical protein
MNILKGIYLEGLSKEELIECFNMLDHRLSTLESKIELNVQHEYSLEELSRAKGYSKRGMRRIISERKIPFTYRGGKLVVTRENAQLISPKK